MSLPDLSSAARRAARRLRARWPVGAVRRCCLCGHKVRAFLPYRDGRASLPAVAVDADIVGSDVENFECPACGCHDRERHLFLYLQAAGLLPQFAGAHILHFAPEAHLQRVIKAAGPAHYERADLFPRQLDVHQLDLTEIDRPDQSFDFVIANHVLEHVGDDARALHEILRVLRPGGQAILQTPFAAARRGTFEDPAIRDDAARLRAFGQEDHCRLYGADFADRVQSFGFVSQVAEHAALLPGVDAFVLGVNPREPFLLFRKTEPMP
jgi:hypothetical protein